MTKVTVRVCDEDSAAIETISAPSIRGAVSIAQARYPEAEVQILYPIDPKESFSRSILREASN